MKLNYTLALACASFMMVAGFTGCSNENESERPNGGLVSVGITADAPGMEATKTYVKPGIDADDNAGFEPYWSQGDEIALIVQVGSTSTRFASKLTADIPAEGAKTAKFTGKIDITGKEGSSFRIYGAYPYKSGSKNPTGYSTTYYGAVNTPQAPTKTSFDPRMDWMAMSNPIEGDGQVLDATTLFEHNAEFKRVWAYLKMSFTNNSGIAALSTEKVTDVTLWSWDKNLGFMSPSMNLTTQAVSSFSSTNVLAAKYAEAEQGELASLDCWLVVRPGTYQGIKNSRVGYLMLEIKTEN